MASDCRSCVVVEQTAPGSPKGGGPRLLCLEKKVPIPQCPERAGAAEIVKWAGGLS